MGRLVSNSSSLPLPLSKSAPPFPLLPNARGEGSSIVAHGLVVGWEAFVGEGRAGEKERRPGEKERLPSTGGGERARFVSGDWS